MSTTLTPSTPPGPSRTLQPDREERIAPQGRGMIRIVRSVWTILIWLFLVLIAVEFYLAGQGAFEMHNASAAAREDAWAAHASLGSMMGVVVLLSLVVAVLGRLPRQLLIVNAALLVFMVIQGSLASFENPASTRWIAALHPVNALIVTGLGVVLGIRGRQFLWPGWARKKLSP